MRSIYFYSYFYLFLQVPPCTLLVGGRAAVVYICFVKYIKSYQPLFSLRRKRFRAVFERRTKSTQNRKSRSLSLLGLPLIRNHTETLATQASHVSGNKRSRTLLESLRFTYTPNVRFKLRISPSRKWAGTPYNSLYGEAPPERGTFSGFRYMKG